MRSVPATVVVLVLLAAAVPAPAQPADGAPVYRNQQLGLELQGPAGWKMAAEATGVSPWSRLVTFYDAALDVEIVVSARARRHASIEELQADVQREWERDPAFQLASIRPVAATPGAPIPSVTVEGTNVVTPPSGAGAARPTPQTWFVTTTHWLAPGHEIMLYARAKSADWPKVRGRVDAVRSSLKLTGAGAALPEGRGSYVDELRAFSCRYPEGYGVVVPARRNHLVEFRGVGADDASIGIYHFTWEGSVDDDVRRLVAFYKDELGGEASSRPTEVSGRSGQLVTARTSVGGRDEIVLLAVLMRDRNEFFRIRATIPAAAEDRGRALFERFLADLEIRAAPR